MTVVSVTEARLHFGEMIRRVTENNETVVVERAGMLQLVMLSIGRYQQLQQEQIAQRQSAWEQVTAVRKMIRERRGATPLTPAAADIIHQLRAEREERDEQRSLSDSSPMHGD